MAPALDHVGMETRWIVVTGRTNDTKVCGRLEYESVEADRQSLSNGFERCFLKGPEPVKSQQAHQPAGRFNSFRLSFRKTEHGAARPLWDTNG
jgi:hypothetical protein